MIYEVATVNDFRDLLARSDESSFDEQNKISGTPLIYVKETKVNVSSHSSDVPFRPPHDRATTFGSPCFEFVVTPK